MSRTILLIDGSSLAFRAFFSILDIERFKNAQGLHTNALFTFNRMLDSVLDQFQPSHVLVAFDKSERTFRTEKFKDYKGGRQKTPSEFREQMPYFRVLLEAYGIKHYEILGYEADDIIGTLSAQADPEDQVIVLSGDKDLVQLAQDHVTVYITRKGVSDIEPYTPETIKEKWGITPLQVIDMKGLMGDPSDNYPGITRIGEKSALKLLEQFGSVEAMYERLDELKPSKMKENIINDKDNAFLSKDLARILHDAPIEIGVEDTLWQGKNNQALREFYQEMDFQTFLDKLEDDGETTAKKIAKEDQILPFAYRIFEQADQVTLDHLPSEAAYFTEMLEANYHFGQVQAIVWSDPSKQQVYICRDLDLFKHPVFQTWLADEKTNKIYLDFKKEAVVAHNQRAEAAGLADDIQIASYLMDTHQGQDLFQILHHYKIHLNLDSDDKVYGKGAKRAIPTKNEVFYLHLTHKAQAMTLLREALLADLEHDQMLDLYRQMELPLAKVLARMEMIGIKVDRQILEEKNQKVIERLATMETEIYQLAGETFNIQSPKQLGDILFDKLGLPASKKTKTGYSTAADVLERLVGKHPIIQAILDYRQLSKLQGTYLAGLPPYIKEDGKIHTRFVQTLTQTGRLSSTDPNLQNIPIRIEEGRQIRQAFVPSQAGWVLVGADYSQIELRVLAHMAKEVTMQEAFIQGQDIHAATARKVFKMDPEEPVTSDHRRQAKAVNFGIVYGISDYGLSQNLNISRKAAKDFIDRYMAEFPGITGYMTSIVEVAREKGYVTTLFNRRRYLPDIHASNFNLRSFAERTAMNSPIQGTAADIIKKAMVNLQEALDQAGLQARLLLQIHDELILETPEEELAQVQDLIKKAMEKAADLDLPLKVDMGAGNNWYELK